jgi:hypothetical protein
LLVRDAFADNPDGLVVLQGLKEEPPMDAKCKDKFLVLSVIVTADQDFSNIASIVRTSTPSFDTVWILIINSGRKWSE